MEKNLPLSPIALYVKTSPNGNRRRMSLSRQIRNKGRKKWLLYLAWYDTDRWPLTLPFLPFSKKRKAHPYYCTVSIFFTCCNRICCCAVPPSFLWYLKFLPPFPPSPLETVSRREILFMTSKSALAPIPSPYCTPTSLGSVVWMGASLPLPLSPPISANASFLLYNIVLSRVAAVVQ